MHTNPPFVASDPHGSESTLSVRLLPGRLSAWALGRLGAWGTWVPGRLSAWAPGRLGAWATWVPGCLGAWAPGSACLPAWESLCLALSVSVRLCLSPSASVCRCLSLSVSESARLTRPVATDRWTGGQPGAGAHEPSAQRAAHSRKHAAHSTEQRNNAAHGSRRAACSPQRLTQNHVQSYNILRTQKNANVNMLVQFKSWFAIWCVFFVCKIEQIISN